MVSNIDQFVWYFMVLYCLLMQPRYLFVISGLASSTNEFDLSHLVHYGCSPEPGQMYVPTVIYVTGSVL